MGKKKRGFQWTEDEDDPERIQPAERPSRLDRKDHLEQVQRLVVAIQALPSAVRRALPLDDDVLDAFDELDRLGKGSALERQVRFVKGLMDGVDVAEIDRALAGDTPRAAWLRSLERWRSRLVDGDDSDLAALLEASPDVDRQQLRTLIRRARSDDKARRKLFDTLKSILPEASLQPSGED